MKKKQKQPYYKNFQFAPDFTSSYRSTAEKQRKRNRTLNRSIVCVLILIILSIMNLMNNKFTNKVINTVISSVNKQFDLIDAGQGGFFAYIDDKIDTLWNNDKNDGTVTTSSSSEKYTVPFSGKITSSFKDRIHPIFNTKVKARGIEITAQNNTVVRASSKGEVTNVLKGTNLGSRVVVTQGNMVFVYDGIEELRVAEKDNLKQGDIIGQINKGKSLIFEIWKDNEAVDPTTLIQ